MPAVLADVASAAIGKQHRSDPALPGTGGPAGNASLTAWLGLLLLVLFLAELVTLLDVRGLISWHVVLGTLLIPPALLKTATTGWRIGRYYLGSPAYRQAGPPPLLLRLLGPGVVVSTLALLGSGLLLILLGPQSSRIMLMSVIGQRVDTVTVHQGLFVIWGVLTGLHVLARIIPALLLTVIRTAGSPAVAGVSRRVISLLLVLVLAAASAWVVLAASGAWHAESRVHFGARAHDLY